MDVSRLAWGVFAAVGLAAVGAAARGEVELPVEVVLADLRSAYSEGPTRELVSVRAESGSDRVVSSLMVEMDPGSGRFELELGPLVCWNEGAEVLVARRSSSGPVARFGGGERALEVLGGALPSLPLPQLFFGLGERVDRGRTLTARDDAVEWTGAVLVDRFGLGEEVRLRGVGEGYTVTLVVDPESGRLLGGAWRFEDGGATLTAEIERLGVAGGGERPSSEGRAEVASIEALMEDDGGEGAGG